MANYKKPTTTVSEEKMANVDMEKKPVAKANPKTYTDFDYILCRSVWSGGLNVTCASGNCYEFKNYGSECEIAYRDLVGLIRKSSDHIFMPRFIICDEEFLELFPQVKRSYDNIYSTADLRDIIDLPDYQMTQEINNLPESAKATLRTLIATEIANGRIDSIRKVKALSEIFDSDFNLLSELFGR